MIWGAKLSFLHTVGFLNPIEWAVCEAGWLGPLAWAWLPGCLASRKGSLHLNMTSTEERQLVHYNLQFLYCPCFRKNIVIMQMIGAIIRPFTVPLCCLPSCFSPMVGETQRGMFGLKLLLADSLQMFTVSSVLQLAVTQSQGASIYHSIAYSCSLYPPL